MNLASNYGSYEKLTNDGLTQWHPAFMQLGQTLDECAYKYRGFCNRYKAKSKPARKCHWGNKLLAGINFYSSKKSKRSGSSNFEATSSSSSSWAGCQVSETRSVSAVARQFIDANQAPWRVQQRI